MKHVVCAALLSLCGSVAVFARSPSLAHLAPGERIHVAYQSRGCFHNWKYEIDFERGASVTARAAGRSVTLSARETAGLDRLLEFYRSRPRGGCTTEDKITITQIRAGKRISSESYVDGSCATYEMKDVTRFYEIAKTLGLEP